MFNSILKTVCCLIRATPSVYGYLHYIAKVTFLFVKVSCLFTNVMRNDVQSYAFNSRKVRISSKSVVYLESYAFVRKKK